MCAAVLAQLAVAVAVTASTVEGTSAKPNIIFILADDLGYATPLPPPPPPKNMQPLVGGSRRGLVAVYSAGRDEGRGIEG